MKRVAGRARLADLEQYHSHFVLVEGDEWGAGTPVMYRVAAAVAAGRPSVAVFAAGGSIALQEMQENIEQNREMILISGSKGSCDAVAAVHSGAPTSERDLLEISSQGKLTTFAPDQKPEFLSLLIADRLLGV